MSARVTACTSCRQVKLKCDIKEKTPGEKCTRCETRKFSCKMDPHFKRVPTRGRLAEVTQKLNSLQEAIASDPNRLNLLTNTELPSVPGNPAPQSATSNYIMKSLCPPLDQSTADMAVRERSSLPSSQLISNMNVRPKRSCMFLEPGGSSGDKFTAESKQLGDVSVDSQTIGELFTHYYHFRHRHLPVINADTTVSKLYDSSPFLFWTILHISCRHNPEYAQLEQKLTASYKDLLATTLITAVTSLQTIQALLLLCLYPFDTRIQHKEHSLNLCGFALSASLQMGLHHPDRLGDYGVLDIPEHSIESRMTWMALFQISTWHSATLGTPPLIQSPAYLDGIRLMCCNPAIPRTFVAQIEIQRHVARYMSTLEGQTDLQSRFSLTQVFDRELESVRSDFKDAWSGKAEYNLLVAKLYLYATYISPKCKPEPSPGSTSIGGIYDATGTSRRIILQLGLATVVRLVQTFKADLGYHQNEQTNIYAKDTSSTSRWGVEFYPKHYGRSLVFAACSLYFIILDEKASAEDEKTACENIDAIYDIFHAFELKYTYDVHAHAADAVDSLRGSVSRGKGLERFEVGSRMGASIFFGAMRARKEEMRRKALDKRRQSQVQQQQSQPPQMAQNAGTATAPAVLPMDLESEFLWQEQLSTEWNSQWGIWGPFESELGNDMGSFF